MAFYTERMRNMLFFKKKDIEFDDSEFFGDYHELINKYCRPPKKYRKGDAYDKYREKWSKKMLIYT